MIKYQNKDNNSQSEELMFEYKKEAMKVFKKRVELDFDKNHNLKKCLVSAYKKGIKLEFMQDLDLEKFKQ